MNNERLREDIFVVVQCDPTHPYADLLNRCYAALRLEISELRAALMPVPSLILTGQQALDEFRRLNGGKP